MATCKKCGKTIEDGLDYCMECSSKKEADESYLDSLLSSVSNNTEPAVKKPRVQTTAMPVMPKFLAKKKIKAENYNILSDKDDDEFLDNLFDSDDIPDFPVDVAAFDSEFSMSQGEGSDDEEELVPSPESRAGYSSSDDEMEMLLGTQAAGIVRNTAEAEDDPEAGYSGEDAGAAEENGEEAFNGVEMASLDMPDTGMSEEDSLLADLLDSVGEDTEREAPADDPIEALNEAFAMAGESTEDPGENIDFFSTNATQEEIENAKNIPEPESENGSRDEGKGPDESLADLGIDILDESNALNLTPEDAEDLGIEIVDENNVSGLAKEQEPEQEPELIPAEIPGEEANTQRRSKVKLVDDGDASGGDEDILEFWNQINGDAPDGAPSANVVQERPMSPEEQAEQDELAALLSGLPGVDEGVDTEGVGEVEAPVEEKPKKKKKGFFAKIFGNVKEELTEEQLEAKKQAALDKLDRDEAKAEQDKVDKEEAKKAKAEAAAEAKKAKAEAAEAAKKKKEEDKKLKADKKAALRKALVEEIEENEGKINKVGASLVFLVFAAALAFVAIGTSIYTYRIAIERAQKDFDDDKYEEAYNDIYGIDVKEEDQTLYDQIMVVNYVNTQLLAYLRYSGLDMDNEALDSLLKGLKRYEKYIYYAAELEVAEDFNFLKGEILQALETRFNLSETDAYNIINSESQELYAKAVREVVEKNPRVDGE